MNNNDIMLQKQPILVIKLFIQYILKKLHIIFNFKLYVLIILVTFLLINIIDYPFIVIIRDILFIILKWFFLGVLSSIGFGTGVPTGVLFLFPLIFTTTIINGYEGIYTTLGELYLPTFCWALGTAIGEIPPYYMAKLVRLNQINNKNNYNYNSEIMNNLQRQIEYIIKEWNFWGILFFASYPNAMFDMCGMACGHFLIPITTFLTATIIGKVFIKANLQLHLMVLFTYADKYLTFLSTNQQTYLMNFVNKMRDPQNYDSHSSIYTYYLSWIWHMIIYIFLAYFTIEFINNIAQIEYKNQNNKLNN